MLLLEIVPEISKSKEDAKKYLSVEAHVVNNSLENCSNSSEKELLKIENTQNHPTSNDIPPHHFEHRRAPRIPEHENINRQKNDAGFETHHLDDACKPEPAQEDVKERSKVLSLHLLPDTPVKMSITSTVSVPADATNSITPSQLSAEQPVNESTSQLEKQPSNKPDSIKEEINENITNVVTKLNTKSSAIAQKISDNQNSKLLLLENQTSSQPSFDGPAQSTFIPPPLPPISPSLHSHEITVVKLNTDQHPSSSQSDLSKPKIDFTSEILSAKLHHAQIDSENEHHSQHTVDFRQEITGTRLKKVISAHTEDESFAGENMINNELFLKLKARQLKTDNLSSKN